MGEESDASDETATVLLNNVPPTATAAELVAFFESEVGPVFACMIDSAHTNWKSRGRGKLQFDSPAYAQKALDLYAEGRLKKFHLCRESEKGPLSVTGNHTDIIPRGTGDRRFENVVVRLGIMAEERKMEVFGEWRGVRVEIVKERGDNALMILLKDGGETYKLTVMFGSVMNSYGCVLGDAPESNAVLLQLRYAPKIDKKICGPSLKIKFNSTRYHFCKEDVKFLWVRTTDFSATSIIGRSCYLCLEFADGLSSLKTPKKLPFFRELGDVILTQGEVSHSSSNLVPIISCVNGCTVPYEVLFQLNSLVHMQKISAAQVNSDLFQLLRGLSLDTAIEILMKMHKLNSTCYNPIDFIQNHLSGLKKQEGVSSSKKTRQENFMKCRRVLVTPSKVYFLGPELETSNYIVKHYSAYASDFLRVTFVDEDRCKILPEILSVRTEQDIFAKPYRTSIYYRILSILTDGISIGSKKFEFLAFSASQLRDSSVWMFASNESWTANDIREWMGEFNDIHSISKCAARMGQLFSSATPTFNVPLRDVKLIPDSDVITDGIKYCFSDGIGKISLSFAKQVAKQCGLSHVPSAFQIRYGGYKGVIAVDRTSFCKLSLRPSMLKFKSNNTMLNVTKWSVSQPCYLNREIIILLSTLGVDDEVFQSLQYDQMRLLDSMLTNREDASRVLHRMSGFGVKTVEKMLNQYGPDSEPFLLRMLKSYQEYQLSDMRSKCRIFVPKGRVLVGCLDELNTLDYGQVYLRVTMTNEELQNRNQACFENVDQSTGVVVGKVVVTKNPCLHPGDIRVLQAVYDHKLDNTMGLVDCLVFPQKGPRYACSDVVWFLKVVFR